MFLTHLVSVATGGQPLHTIYSPVVSESIEQDIK